MLLESNGKGKRVIKKELEYCIDEIMMSNANLKEQEKRIKEIRILLNILTYLGFYDREETETSGDFVWTFPYTENLVSLIPFDEPNYLREISERFLIEFIKEPHKTVPFNLDNQVCGYAIL